jgi:hypothetical protein
MSPVQVAALRNIESGTKKRYLKLLDGIFLIHLSKRKVVCFEQVLHRFAVQRLRRRWLGADFPIFELWITEKSG